MRAGKHTIEVVQMERNSDKLSNLQIRHDDGDWKNMNKKELCDISAVQCDTNTFN
jgi:hypothetical protein